MHHRLAMGAHDERTPVLPLPRRRRRRRRRGRWSLNTALVAALVTGVMVAAAAASATARNAGGGGGPGGGPGGGGYATVEGTSGRRGRVAAYAAMEAAGDAGLPPAAGFRVGRCGPLLPAVLSRCSIDVPHVDKVACCAALVAFNDARCWCDVHAFNFLTVIAGNDYAYFYRAYDCVPSGATVYHPRLPPPAAVEGAVPVGTCPKAVESVAPGDGEGCGAAGGEAGSAAATALREERQRVVAILLSVNLRNRHDVDEYEAMLATLLTPDASLAVVQLGRFTGRTAVLEYLLSRTSAASGVPFSHPAMATGVQRLPPLWTSSGEVALTADASADTAFYRTHLWVRFARCAPEVADVWVADNELGRLHDQFAYFDDARLLAKYMTPAAGWCSMLAARCVGPLYPYASPTDCLVAYKGLRRRKRIMCNDADGGVDMVPPWGLDGNTVACRAMYVDLSAVRPGRYCRLLATTTPARCAEGACPPGGYGDPFGRANPRHSGGGGFECTINGCREKWYDKNEWD